MLLAHTDALVIPAVVCGPGSMEGRGHKPDVSVEASLFAACDAMLSRLVARLGAGS